MTNHNNPQYREQLEGKIAKYTERLNAGIDLSWQEYRELRHMKRQLYQMKHNGNYPRQPTIRNIRNCLDQQITAEDLSNIGEWTE